MSWVKRNLSLVISGIIALALLGFGGWYLWQAMERNKAADAEIGGAKSEIERLLGMDPAPTTSNRDTLKREFDRLTAFNGQAKRLFPSAPAMAGPLNDQSFKSLLQTTIDDLHKQASSVGIKVDTNYYFTFENQKLPMRFSPQSLHPLRERLQEVQTIASLLFKARINRLEGMKRATVPGEQPGAGPGNAAGAADYLYVPPRSNAETGMVLWPYEITFHCFTPELAAVLEAFERAPQGFVVKSIVSAAGSAREGPGNPPPPVVPKPGDPPRRTNPPPALVTVVNEKLLRVTLRIEVIKPAS
jgi:hypothetical protein